MKLSYLEDKNFQISVYDLLGVDEKNSKAQSKKISNLNLKHFCESIIMASSNYDFKLKYFLGEKMYLYKSFNNKKLILVNRYKIESSEDALYSYLAL